jgi:RNA polymerase sigma factor (sigma-70 family)
MRFPRTHNRNDAGRALTVLYVDHAVAAFRYALHLTGSREDAEDLVQAAFLEAHRRLTAGGEIVNPRAWLSTVVRHRAYNLSRDRREESSSDRLEELAGGSAEGRQDAAADLDRVRAVLYQLPEPQHQAFVLRHWSDLSYREIAAVLGTTEPAVESLLVRARAAVMGHAEVPDECVEVRARLSADASVGGSLRRHLDSCARCRTAQSRLARAAGIAAALALVPRMHVAQALAATVPGFSAAGAIGAGSAGAGGSIAAGKAGLLAKAAVTVVAVAGSAAAIHAHVAAASDPVRHERLGHVLPRVTASVPGHVPHPVATPPATARVDGSGTGGSRDGLGGDGGGSGAGADSSGSGGGQTSGDSGGSGSTSGDTGGGSTSGDSGGGGQSSGDTSGAGGGDSSGGGVDTSGSGGGGSTDGGSG